MHFVLVLVSHVVGNIVIFERANICFDISDCQNGIADFLNYLISFCFIDTIFMVRKHQIESNKIKTEKNIFLVFIEYHSIFY